MSTWLKQRLVLWFGSALALAFIGFRVMAQSAYALPATAGEAAQLFGRLLRISGPENELVMGSADYSLKYRLISSGDRQNLGMPAITVLLQDLAKESQTPARPFNSPPTPRFPPAINSNAKPAKPWQFRPIRISLGD